MAKINNFFHAHPGGTFVGVEILAALFLIFHGGGLIKSPAFLAVFGGALGAWLNMLDVLCDHKALKVKKPGIAAVTKNDVLYLTGRTILGGMSGFVVLNVWGQAAPVVAHEFTGFRSLGILAGFSTTTMAKLSKGTVHRPNEVDDADEVDSKDSSVTNQGPATGNGDVDRPVPSTPPTV